MSDARKTHGPSSTKIGKHTAAVELLAPSPRRSSLLVGDLVETAFDSAAYVTSDPAQRLELAACHLGRLLGRLGDDRLVRLLASTPQLRRRAGRPGRSAPVVRSSAASAAAAQLAH